MKVPNQTKTLLISGVIARSQDIGKEIVTNWNDSSLTNLSNLLPILQKGAPRNCRASSPSSFNWLGETFLQTGDESLSILNDTRATFLVFNTIIIKQPLPQNTKTVQMLDISNGPQEVPVSEFIPFCLALWEILTLSFLISSSIFIEKIT